MHGWSLFSNFTRKEKIPLFFTFYLSPALSFSFSSFNPWTTNADMRSNVGTERRTFRWISLNRSSLSIIVRIDAYYVPADEYLMKLAITDQLGRYLGRRSWHPGLPFHENTEGLEAFTSSLTVGGHESKSSVDEDLSEQKKAWFGLIATTFDRTELTDRSRYHDSTFNLSAVRTSDWRGTAGFAWIVPFSLSLFLPLKVVTMSRSGTSRDVSKSFYRIEDLSVDSDADSNVNKENYLFLMPRYISIFIRMYYNFSL